MDNCNGKSGVPVSEELKVAYQTLTYNLGIKAYNKEQYKEAISYFDKAISQAANQNVTDEASFGKAECLSQLKDFEAAILVYKPLLSGKHSADFVQRNRIGIAYAYFSVKDFTNANTYFKTYVDQLKANPNGKANANAVLRLADTYLVAKNYTEALTYYNQAIENAKTEKDYAMYQKGIKTTISTDCPVEPLNPFHNLYCATTRQSIKHNNLKPFIIEESFTLQDALKCYTETPYYFSYEENNLYNDYILINEEIRNDNLLKLLVEEVVIDGKIVYTKK